MRKKIFKIFAFLQIMIAFSCAGEESYLTARLLGQTGNMLFQIAAASAVAWDHQAEAYFPDLKAHPVAYYHLFSRCKMNPPSDEVSAVVGEEFPICFQPKMQLQGYFQAEKYFARYREKILELFAPSAKDLKYIQKKYAWLLAHPHTVGVQIRYYRREVTDGFPQYGRRYLEQAMALFPETSLFVVSSDNLHYARQQVPPWIKNVYFIEKEAYYIDFYLLSLCKDNVISNSSFGWWSAWLNQNPHKKVVCPSVWTSFSTEDIFPKEWIRVNAQAEDL